MKLIPNIETPGTDPKYFQLAEIRRVKLSSILCDNSDDIENIQVKVLMFIRTFVGSKVQRRNIRHHYSWPNQPVAGVRDGSSRPRDQPASSLQVRRSPQDRPQPLEGRLLPRGAFPGLPQWLWQEVERLCCSPLVCSSHFLLLVRHARTLSPMSDSQTHL